MEGEDPRRVERLIALSSNAPLLNRLKGAIFITISDEEKGWKWAREPLESKLIIFRSEFVLRPLGNERALLFTNDENSSNNWWQQR